MNLTRAKLEFKIEDCWVGVFWKHGYCNTDQGQKKLWTDIWICIVPCLPIHLTFLRNRVVVADLASEPRPDPKMVKASLEAYSKGDWQTSEEIIEELKGKDQVP